MVAAVLGAVVGVAVVGVGMLAPAPEALGAWLRRSGRDGRLLAGAGVPFALAVLVATLLGAGPGRGGPLVSVLGLLALAAILCTWFAWAHRGAGR